MACGHRTPALGRARIRGARVFYGSVDAGVGGLYTALFVIVARMLGMRAWLHHHNYNYVARSSPWMRVVVAAGGRRTHHVVLCDEMAAQFRTRYPGARRIVVARNVALEDSPHPQAPGLRLTLGLLSNLTSDKGVEVLLDIRDRLATAGVMVDLLFAGPAGSDAIADLLRSRAAREPDAVRWIGPVDADEKQAFFAQIDAFVFPTRMESFGIVLMEALLAGVPVIAPAHGCICLLSSCDAATIVPLSHDFPDAVVERLRRANPRAPRGAGAAIRDAALLLNAEARATQDALIDALVADARSGSS